MATTATGAAKRRRVGRGRAYSGWLSRVEPGEGGELERAASKAAPSVQAEAREAGATPPPCCVWGSPACGHGGLCAIGGQVSKAVLLWVGR